MEDAARSGRFDALARAYPCAPPELRRVDGYGVVDLGDGTAWAFHPLQRIELRATDLAVSLDDGDWTLHMSLQSWGTDRLVPARRPVITAVGDRITLDRGPIEEWYVNAAEAIAQGFTVREPPQGAPGAVRLSLALDTTLTPVAAGRDTIVFRDDEGPVASLRGLTACDATHTALPSRWVLSRRGSAHCLEVVVDVGDATYPITVDPMRLTQIQTRAGLRALANA